MSDDDGRWRDIVTTAARGGSEVGEWVDLPRIPRSALVAFVAGPGKVRASPVGAGVPTVRARQEGPHRGQLRAWAPLDDDDLAAELTVVTDYLSVVGVPAPPAVFDWSVRLPPRLTGDQALAAIEAADTDPPVSGDLDADMAASARSVAAAVAELWGVANPLA